MGHLTPYIPIALILVLACGFGMVSVVMGRVLGPRRPNAAKSMAYESGIIPTGDASLRVPIKFYMVAILFLLFDIESIFIIAWAVVFRGTQIDFNSPAVAFTPFEFRFFALMEMVVFVVILLVGYVYVWRKGGFRWS